MTKRKTGHDNADSRPGPPERPNSSLSQPGRGAAGVYPVGNDLLAGSGAWHFGGDTWRVFDQHIRNSVPFYDQLHELIELIARDQARPAETIVELGCSTGNLSYRLALALPEANVFGVDAEPGMIARAQTRPRENLAYHCEDIRTCELPVSSLVTLCYTLQFVEEADRPALIDRIHAALAPDGMLVLAEKVRNPDAELEAMQRRWLHTFKRLQGFSREEIEGKDASLHGVLVPWTEEANLALLRDAGFRKVVPLFRNTQFAAWLALK